MGNGGDPLFDFFEAARTSMINTLNTVRFDPKEQEIFCKLESLSFEESQFCKQFFLAVLPEMLELSGGPNKTAFVLRKDYLEVYDHEGNRMIVAARTELGPKGPIELHRDSVKTLTPAEALFLITHEFLHKVAYEGAYVTDNDEIWPFRRGRYLLDAAAKYLTNLAKRAGHIGTYFGIDDTFECNYSISGTLSSGGFFRSRRMYFSNDFMSYESSLGKTPLDGTPKIPDSPNSWIGLSFKITEPNNCLEPSSNRKTSLKVLRWTRLPDRSHRSEVLSELELGYNPMCPKSSTKFEISWEKIQFSCEYFGSQGSTLAPHTLKGFSSRNWQIPAPMN